MSLKSLLNKLADPFHLSKLLSVDLYKNHFMSNLLKKRLVYLRKMQLKLNLKTGSKKLILF